MTSMPFNSSPWTAAVRHSTGPGPFPLSTITGTGTTKPSIAVPLVQVSRLRVPGGMSLPRRRSLPFAFSTVASCDCPGAGVNDGERGEQSRRSGGGDSRQSPWSGVPSPDLGRHFAIFTNLSVKRSLSPICA